MNKINNGQPTTVWHGIPSNYIVRRCAVASPDEAAAMSAAASLMLAGECTETEWLAAEQALASVDRRLCVAWEREHGEPRRNRNGQYWGGAHPALT